MSKDTNELLESCKNLFEGLVIIGVKKDGNIDLRTNVGDFFQIQGVLTEASHELFLYKKAMMNQSQQQDANPEVVEAEVIKE